MINDVNDRKTVNVFEVQQDDDDGYDGSRIGHTQHISH